MRASDIGAKLKEFSKLQWSTEVNTEAIEMIKKNLCFLAGIKSEVHAIQNIHGIDT